MDIWLLRTDQGMHISAASVHGMLWLQTHFEEEAWEALASGQVRIPTENAQELSIDAQNAGLSINFLPTFSVAGKF